MAKPQSDRADASALLDDRGYSGALIRGQNPALLMEKGVRDRITESYYWKEQCFGLNAATLCDRAVELRFIGGTTGIMGKPTPFLCLAFKLLQLVPDKKIMLEYLNFKGDDEEEEEEQEKEGAQKSDDEANGDDKKKPDLNASGKLGSFKYLRCLAAFYIRLAWEPVEIYKTLEPLLTDYRKIKRRLKDAFTLTHVDQFIDDLLTRDRICATSLWKLPSRANLEDLDMLEPRESPLGDEVDELDEDEVMKDDGEDDYRSRSGSFDSRRRGRSRSYDSRSPSYSRSRSRSRSRRRSDSRSGSYDSRDRRRSLSPRERRRDDDRKSSSRSRSRSRRRNGNHDDK